MSTPLRQLLAQYRDASKSEREKGTYFERLAVAFIKRDPGMAQEYEECWDFASWARMNHLPAGDNGIDAVAKIRGEDSFCAIQCKFYREGATIARAEIDGFLATLAASPHFSRGLIIETTGREFSPNASARFDGLNVTSIGLDRLEESPIDWAAFLINGEIRLEAPKALRPHQQEALKAVQAGLAESDRGKLIMACGTGKTFTGLKIAEAMAGPGKTVLVLVPSLALMSQTIREWTIDAGIPLRSYAVCSDSQVGKRRRDKDDVAEVDLHDLDYPATTNAARLAGRASHVAPDRMTVVFSTYQSIQVISDAQKLNGFPEFDLIICDEAHRTTGATLAGEDESNFVKVHNQDFLKGKKRLYMTATPRVFGDAVKVKAGEVSAELASMDDVTLYGETLFTRGFGWAVENGLLTDYKVLVLAVDEAMVSAGVQNRLKDDDNSLLLDDATKIIGCYKALIKSDLKEELAGDGQPMRRALAFCKDIASSQLIRTEFQNVVSEYLASDEGAEALGDVEVLECQLRHVDGTMGAKERGMHLEWLKEEHGDPACRILSNARCLSEGVDVPALDAILFMHPRKSQIDVVQSVGRVMRRAPGKQMGYVILPIGVPAGVTPEEALNDNERYRVVWQILNALRSHDERLDAQLNQADLGVDISGKIEVIAVSNTLPNRTKAKSSGPDIGKGGDKGEDNEGEPTGGDSTPRESDGAQLPLAFDEFSKAIMAKIVKKCGRRDYWENWAGDIAKIAQTHISRITGLVDKPGTPVREAFEGFLAEIRDDLNGSITEGEAIEMLAQHLITRPVFDALFEGYSFAQNNPVSKAMEAVLAALDEHRLEKEADSLQRFYDSVKRRAAGINKSDAKQKIIVELYDKFFRNAFPKMTERLGIVYTPVEVVDFIIHSVNEVLQSEFDQTLGSKGVHIMDPFTGTGTFVTRLLQSGLIKPEELEHKYKHEIHANEIVLLAYYIAAINIEAAYHGVAGGDYVPFQGICLTDTFQLYEQERDLISDLLADNSNRRTRQKELDIRVIVGNPPYSVGQGSANDDAPNLTYQKLDERIRDTYAARSQITNKNTLYDSYIRAMRWASDRIGEAGVVGFVTNAGWVDGGATDGLRKCFDEEFSSVHVFHLRGKRGQKTSGERAKQEGGQIFGSGSSVPVAIVLLVKNPTINCSCNILFHDIGDYLSRNDKLKQIADFGSIEGISSSVGWTKIVPNQHGDWLAQRSEGYSKYIISSDKKANGGTFFSMHSRGVQTARDAWCVNSSKSQLWETIERASAEYNRRALSKNLSDIDPSKFSWCEKTRKAAAAERFYTPNPERLVLADVRPFTRAWLYTDNFLNWSAYRQNLIFPAVSQFKNRAIGTPSRGFSRAYSAIMVKNVPLLHHASLEASEYLPQFVFSDDVASDEGGLFNENDRCSSTPLDGITDYAYAEFRNRYPDEEFSKSDLFYYAYGMLHSMEYRSKFADDLTKELPRIPAVKKAADFRTFIDAGRQLGDLHCDYETAEPYPVTFVRGDTSLAAPTDPEAFYRVEQMKFAGKRPNLDKATVIYNANITISGIPLEAYEYVVNGKPAIEWVIERQCVKTDKASGIVNDANRYAIESVGDPAYPLLLLQRVITVSLETMKIVRSLPKLEIG